MISALTFLVGCGTNPVTVPAAVPILEAQAPELMVPGPGLVRVVVKRDTGFTGAACAKQVFIQGREAARLKPGEKVTFYLKPGTYVISSKPTGICGGGLVEVEARVASDDPPTYRISSSLYGGDTIARTAF